MAERISYVYDDEIASRRKEQPPVVEILTKRGATVSRQDNIIYGMPEKPLAGADLINKFRDCVSFSVIQVPTENIERAITMVERLEELDDVGKIMEILTTQHA
jgi:2-methylcitrate dehydratase PrpD